MTFPAFLFGSTIAILVASVFHLIVGGNLNKYISYILFSWFGFWLGYYLSNQIAFSIWKVGILDLGINIACSLIILGIIFWIDKGSEEDTEKKEKE